MKGFIRKVACLVLAFTMIMSVNAFAIGPAGVKDCIKDKDKAIILVLPESVRQERQGQRSYDSNKDTFESKPEEFQHRVDNAYLKIAKEYNIPLLGTSGNIDETQQQIRQILGI